MQKKAFTMTSNRYCGDCGSFDLVISKPSWVQQAMGAWSRNYCYGCDRHCSEKDFLKNSPRTLPLTVDDFFFQTNLRAEYLKNRQIQPIACVLSIGLIVSGLFLYKSPNELEGVAYPILEWATVPSEALETHETVVNALQLEIEQWVKAK